MKKAILQVISALALSALIGGCGGGGGGGGAVPPPPPPPPPTAQSPAGLWNGLAVTAASPDVFTSFEFNANGGFSVGTAPFTAAFSNGNAETRGVPGFYITGLNAWHVLVGTSATVTFGTNPQTLSFWVRTVAATDVAAVRILDENSTLIQSVVPSSAYQQITVNRSAGQTSIGSVEVISTSGGDVVIDDFTFGYLSTTDDIGCLVAESNEFVCVVSDVTTDDVIATAHGTVAVANANQVSGTGKLYAGPGLMLADGSTVADLTISSGIVVGGTSLNVTISAAGESSTVTTLFDDDYNRASDLATVAAVYSLFELFGDASSFAIDASGVISGQSTAGCMISGQISIIDALFNAYDVQITVSNCGGSNGVYDGLGVTTDLVATNDALVFVAFTDLAALLGEAAK